MEGKKQSGHSVSSSSFTAELFGGTGSSSSSSQDQHSKGIFASIFPPPPKVGGRNSASSEALGSWQKHAPGNQAWPTNKHGNSANGGGEGARCSLANKERSSFVQEQKMEPCHLSSSIYYGGQDMYSRSPNSQVAPNYPDFKNDGEEDDPNGSDASRGNWWQGSLYY